MYGRTILYSMQASPGGNASGSASTLDNPAALVKILVIRWRKCTREHVLVLCCLYLVLHTFAGRWCWSILHTLYCALSFGWQCGSILDTLCCERSHGWRRDLYFMHCMRDRVGGGAHLYLVLRVIMGWRREPILHTSHVM